ncbi:MAG TPA: efflux transporter outer membrane subunit [Steroidobacteraceae bacterium]|nr:efflux transporter outer membrane subunit [Steroidobacteraceae bacterium]HUA23713.1 efflux transporter outer membrane subunit [Steroidobacteraceae bacterium]
MRKPSTLAVALVLTGCVVGPNYRPPTTTVPRHWSANPAEPSSAQALKSFWTGFQDPMLTRLIERAIDDNYDLKIAGERIRAAYDTVRVAAAGSLPQIGFGAAVESRRETQTLDWPPRTPYGEYPYYGLGINASWELDLFGETKRRTESARAAADAAVEARRDILVSLTAAVASNYLSYRATELRLQIAQQNLDIARQTQTLAHRGFEFGERSHLDVSEADGRVHGVEATIPPLQAHADDLAHALAILLAQAPAQFRTSDLHSDAPIPAPPPLPPSLPSEVIAQRPDIRRAEREYAESNANVGVAVADLYPHFSIPLSFGPSTSQIHELFRSASLLWRMGLDGTQSLYTGGRLTANVDAARANKEAALFSYQQTVLRAFGEVEDALSSQMTEETRYRALTAQLADDRQALREAQERYRRGQVALLPVLEDQQQLYATQDAQVTSALTRCLADISLFKALGGSWQQVALPDFAADRSAINRR